MTFCVLLLIQLSAWNQHVINKHNVSAQAGIEFQCHLDLLVYYCQTQVLLSFVDHEVFFLEQFFVEHTSSFSLPSACEFRTNVVARTMTHLQNAIQTRCHNGRRRKYEEELREWLDRVYTHKLGLRAEQLSERRHELIERSTNGLVVNLIETIYVTRTSAQHKLCACSSAQ